MGAGVALAMQLAITALQHATELNVLVSNAMAQGRDVSLAEVAALRAKAVDAFDALEAQHKRLHP